MVMTAGIALWNMGAGYVAGLLLYHSTKQCRSPAAGPCREVEKLGLVTSPNAVRHHVQRVGTPASDLFEEPGGLAGASHVHVPDGHAGIFTPDTTSRGEY